MATASGRIEEDITWASLALLYYDYVLTSGREVELVWKAKFSPSTVLYVLCRYALLANLLYLLAFRDQIGLSCDKWYKIIAVLGVLGRAAVIVTFTLRTYVVWAQSRLVLLSLVMIGLSTVMTDALYVPHQTCENSTGNAAAIDLARSFLTIVFETLSAILIFIRCLQAFRRGESLSGQRNFTYLLGEQGALYFCIVSLFTIATFVLKLATKTKFLHDLLNAFTLPVSGLLTARFLLNLRDWNNKQSASVSYPAAVDGEGKSHLSTSTQSVSITGLTSSTWTSTAEFGEDPVVTMTQSRGLPA